MFGRRPTAVFVGLLALLALVVFLEVHSPQVAPVVVGASEQYEPIPVENPALRLDLLDRLKKFEYDGTHRSIFSATLPPPPAPVNPAPSVRPTTPPPPPGPPPLVVPATFFGYVTDAQTGTRRAFFNEGDDVYVVAVGEVLLGRFRLIQIGNNTAELEEMTTGRRTTVTLTEEPGNS